MRAHVYWDDSAIALTRFMRYVEESMIASHVSDEVGEGEVFEVLGDRAAKFEDRAREFGCTVEWGHGTYERV